MIWLRCYCSRKGDRLIIRRCFSLGKDQKRLHLNGHDRVLAPISYGGVGKMCAEGRTKQGEAAYTDGLDSPQILQKEENSVRFGRGFPKKHSRRAVWEQGTGGKSSQRRGAACDFLGGREPLCQNRGSLLRIKFQSLGFIKSRRVFQSKSRNRGERPCGDFQKPPLEKRQTAPYNSLMT